MRILAIFFISSFILFSQKKNPIETLSLDEAGTFLASGGSQTVQAPKNKMMLIPVRTKKNLWI